MVALVAVNAPVKGNGVLASVVDFDALMSHVIGYRSSPNAPNPTYPLNVELALTSTGKALFCHDEFDDPNWMDTVCVSHFPHLFPPVPLTQSLFNSMGPIEDQT